MPIKPPNLDDRRYDDLVREARALIPQYCPEWTNLSDADPGMTLVQLFAWMTEMTIYRLNRVPDKTYVHFLNFIGEERRAAQPAVVPVTFSQVSDRSAATELPSAVRVSTSADSGAEPLHYITLEPLTVHGAAIDRVVAVRSGDQPLVREIRPRPGQDLHPSVLALGEAAGVRVFDADPAVHGASAYTSEHYLYLGHDGFSGLDFRVGGGQEAGRLRLRSTGQQASPIADLFRWEGHTADGWAPIDVVHEAETVRGLPDVSIVAQVPDQVPLEHFGPANDPMPVPESFRGTTAWIRGVVDYERWLAARMREDLQISWKDDRGGEARTLTNWSVRHRGRALEFSILDMPPLRAGWTLSFTMVDRGMPAGRDTYFPRYRFSVRRGERWEPVPLERVRLQGATMVVTGPLLDLATDGVNLRAERIETVSLDTLVPQLGVAATWVKPVDVHLAAGSGVDNAETVERASLPQRPFEPALGLPAAMGMKLYLGSDLFSNSARRAVLVQLEVSFEVDGEPVAEPAEGYHFQLTYRTADAWRVVHTADDRFAKFTVADLDPDGATATGRRVVRLVVDPKDNLAGVTRAVVAGVEAAWLRLELTRAQLVAQPDPSQPPSAVSVVLHSVRLGIDGVLERTTYEESLSGLKVAAVEYRAQNRRMSRSYARDVGRVLESAPFDAFIDLDPLVAHAALYFRLTEALPAGSRHAIRFRCVGQTYLPDDVEVTWELLEGANQRWRRVSPLDDGYRLDQSGTLAFSLPQALAPAPAGTWLRAVFRTPEGTPVPALPALSHVLLNTVEAVNLHRFASERFSGQGVAHQELRLRRSPLFVAEAGERSVMPVPSGDAFVSLEVQVQEEDGRPQRWTVAPGNSMLAAGAQDRVFTVDPVDGVLTFGNGIRGRMLPVGQQNVTVEAYHVVPGGAGNVGPGMVRVADGLSDRVTVTNALPAQGGRDAESIDEIIRRAPAALTSRDRAVTRGDFEVIAQEASGQIARASCTGEMGDQGEIEVVVLAHQSPDDTDAVGSTGLVEHVQRYLARRCLVNVQPRVRLASFLPIDVSVSVRLRPQVSLVAEREAVAGWVRGFLDPYRGGIDAEGWPFGAPLLAADLGRMVSDLPGVRHVVDVRAYPVAAQSGGPGWEQGGGQSAMSLEGDDLFSVRHVRVVVDEGPV